MDNQRTWGDRLKDFLHLVRWWNLLIAAAGFMLSYLVWIAPVASDEEFTGMPIPIWTIIGISLVIMYMLAFGYIHNDWRDRLADRINVHDRPLVHHQVSRGKIMLTLIGIGLLGWLLALWIGWVLNKMEFALLFPLVPVLLYLYNRYLKHRPLIGNILIAVLCSGVPWLAWLAVPNPAGRWELANLPDISILGLGMLSILVFLSMLAREIVKDLEDRAGDLAAGSRTLPIVSGPGTAKKMVNLLLSGIPILLISGFVYRFSGSWPHWMPVVVHSLIVAAFVILAWRSVTATRRVDYHKLDRWIKNGVMIGTLDLIYIFGPWNH